MNISYKNMYIVDNAVVNYDADNNVDNFYIM